MNFKSVFLILLAHQISFLSSELLRAPLQPHFDYAFTKFRPPPPPPEPTFIQRITNWIFPWGWSSEEEQLSIPAMPKIDSILPPPGPAPSLPVQPPQTRVMNTYPVRDTEPTTARTTRAVLTKCSPCNKIPWIPMMPTYQLPILKGNNQQVFVAKHHFGNENPYVQVPASNQGYQYNSPSTISPATQPQKVQDVYGVPSFTYGAPSTTKFPPIKIQENVEQLYGVPHSIYGIPSTSKPPPIKLQQLPIAHQTYGVPQSTYGPPSTTTKPLKIQQTYGIPQNTYDVLQSTYGTPSTSTVKPPSNIYGYPTVTQATSYQHTTPYPAFPPSTTQKINANTIDTSVITFTTTRPQNNRPLRFTSPQDAVTNPEYLPPPNILPLEGENSAFKPIPIPHLSPTPIPPLFDAKHFHDNPYTSQKTGFIKLVPLEPVAQLSNNVDVQVKPNKNGVEVVNSRLVAEFLLNPEGTRENNQSIKQNGPVKINIDVGNNLDNFNATLSAPILVESAELVTDAAFAASEKEFHHNVQQELSEDDYRHVTSYDQQLKQDETNGHRVPINNEEETTTTESNYHVKFEPSIQTAADLEDETKRQNSTNYKNRDRETPLEMLDLPIQHRTTTLRTTTLPPPPPPFKPIQDFTKTLATLWTAATRTIPSSTQSSITTTLKPTVNSFIAKLSGITLQKITTTTSTKKPKQIVLPYSTINRPSPFKPQDEQDFATYKPFIRGHYVTHPPRIISTTKLPTTIFDFTTTNKNDLLYNAHGYHNDEEYQVAQESQIIESKVKIEPPNSNERLTKIIANNIRELLRKEKTSPKPVKIDLIKLQRNIDGWTEQSFKGKASTMAIFGHTKAIPTSYLTKMMTTTTFPTTTLSPKTTFDPDLMEETKKQYENILYKHDNEQDELYVKRHDRFLNRDNELVLLNNNLTQNAIKQGVKVYAPKSTLSPKELWHRLHLTVSPLTNERVYVVTPQPPSKDEINDDTTIAYKPRFAIRPTIAGNLFKMRLYYIYFFLQNFNFLKV